MLMFTDIRFKNMGVPVKTITVSFLFNGQGLACQQEKRTKGKKNCQRVSNILYLPW